MSAFLVGVFIYILFFGLGGKKKCKHCGKVIK